MQRRIAVIALLSGAAAIALIVLLSGGSDEKPGTAASTPSPSTPSEERGDARSGSTGATGSDGPVSGAGSTGSASRRARRARRRLEARRGPRRQEQGRLGTGGSPAQGERLDRGRPGAAVATITLIGGAPVGGVQRVRFPKDDRVRLIVRSNTDEVVEIPGYRLTRRVRAGGSARFYFETSKEGLFSIELTRGQTRIGVLAVG